MAPRADSPDCSGDDSDPVIPDNASNNFTVPETNHALDFLLKDPAKYLSGNGFKEKACTEISTSLNTMFPNRPIRKKNVVGNRLRYVKAAFEDYEFVHGKSGVGWDDEHKMATAETEFVETFVQATGAHVLHLTKRTKKSTSSSTSVSVSASASTSTSALASVSSSATAPSSPSTPKCKRARQPLENLDNDIINIDSESALNQPPSPKPYDNELLPAPPKRRRLRDEPGHDNENNDESKKDDGNGDESKKKASARDRDRSVSASSSSGDRRALRNAEAGNEIARGLKMIGEGMSAPIITKADTSHVDAIIDAFGEDPTLLPEDPDGEYYALFLDSLSANAIRARSFVKATNRIQRIALLKRVLVEKGMELPLHWT
ncbi:hypothetical protein C8F04DRAFT_1272467 [Mycena alexandri]|uniref:Myb/SANT-like domain-containing protein n=1 Tax=Mycena alexandri TaxID=1745969 RepID=A0AAD6S7H4_9AGAR|nr:hypothetical protein C8F04DRAFT_1272467 [Mycena alexandri]